MALIAPPDRVLETSTTTGTGTYTLLGAMTGFQTASSVCTNGDTAYYYAEAVDVDGFPTGAWETGLGTWATGGTLARTTIHTSSNANAAVSWAAGIRRISLSLTATAIKNRGFFDSVAPAFSAYLSANQSIATTTLTKVQCNTEEFDLTNAYDNATNYRFTPTVPGIYLVSFSAGCGASSTPTRVLSTVYKNGAEFKRGSDGTFTAAALALKSNGTALVQMNGTTDYIELFALIIATTPVIDGDARLTYFQASLIRGT
jgi:hypothetical protein